MKRLDRNRPSVIVIGAGLSGLATARALQQRGADIRIFDKAPRIAEAWRYRHPQLRLNTHRWLSSLPGLVMPRSAGAFPRRDDVIRYLEVYVDHIDVPLHLGIEVRRIDPGPRKDGWSRPMTVLTTPITSLSPPVVIAFRTFRTGRGRANSLVRFGTPPISVSWIATGTNASSLWGRGIRAWMYSITWPPSKPTSCGCRYVTDR